MQNEATTSQNNFSPNVKRSDPFPTRVDTYKLKRREKGGLFAEFAWYRECLLMILILLFVMQKKMRFCKRFIFLQDLFECRIVRLAVWRFLQIIYNETGCMPVLVRQKQRVVVRIVGSNYVSSFKTAFLNTPLYFLKNQSDGCKVYRESLVVCASRQSRTSSTNSVSREVIIYNDDHGRDLWFEQMKST